ncbi:MAG: hypothetical protein XD78_1418 [Desulfotomaculum sp. 46_296]|nr:MAG: hypothetical protein XD78_1418 [Desulfotomaculum sp. 46_296]HAU31995.1 hypothetical protein [Desulfotomaculum sp.]
MNLTKHDQLLTLGKKLLESPWPMCDQIARQIYEMGGEEAKKVLLGGLKGKSHHIRLASIKMLTEFHDASLADYIKPFLDDPLYETRMQAKKSLAELTGEEISAS